MLELKKSESRKLGLIGAMSFGAGIGFSIGYAAAFDYFRSVGNVELWLTARMRHDYNAWVLRGTALGAAAGAGLWLFQDWLPEDPRFGVGSDQIATSGSERLIKELAGPSRVDRLQTERSEKRGAETTRS